MTIKCELCSRHFISIFLDFIIRYLIDKNTIANNDFMISKDITICHPTNGVHLFVLQKYCPLIYSLYSIES